MKRINNTIILLIAVLILLSCNRKDYLDIKPQGVVIPATLSDFRLILDNVVSAASSGSVTSGLKDKHQGTTLMSDNVNLNPDLLLALYKLDSDARIFMFEDRVYAPTEDDKDWNIYYQHIYVANVVLSGLQAIADPSPQKAVLEAEARLHRAYAYFNLVNMYATHYNSTTAGTDLGVPIRTGIELAGVNLARASVQAVYDLVIEDILFGTKNLDDKQPFELQFRPSKAAAFGLLSRVYLYQARYTEALAAAETAIGLQGTLRDINNDPMSPYAPNLRIFPVQNADPEVIWFKDQGPLAINSPSTSLMGLYENGDLRSEWYCAIRDHLFLGSDVDGLVYAAQLFVNNTSGGVRTSELYLIRAECNARLGHLPEANRDINTLRKKRFKPANFADVAITDQPVMLKFVKEERRREMATDAERLFDIKRYNLFDHDNISITRTYNGNSVTVTPGSKKWVLPIAEKYILINPEIQQNPRN